MLLLTIRHSIWLFNHSFQQSWHFGIPGLFSPDKRPLKRTDKMHVNVIYPSPTSSSGCRILAQTSVVREKHLHHEHLNSHAWPKHYFSSPHQCDTKQANNALIISWSKTKFSQRTSYELYGRKWRELLNHNAPLEKLLSNYYYWPHMSPW